MDTTFEFRGIFYLFLRLLSLTPEKITQQISLYLCLRRNVEHLEETGNDTNLERCHNRITLVESSY